MHASYASYGWLGALLLPTAVPSKGGGQVQRSGSRPALISTFVRNPDLQKAQVHNPDLAVGA